MGGEFGKKELKGKKSMGLYRHLAFRQQSQVCSIRVATSSQHKLGWNLCITRSAADRAFCNFMLGTRLCVDTRDMAIVASVRWTKTICIPPLQSRGDAMKRGFWFECQKRGSRGKSCTKPPLLSHTDLSLVSLDFCVARKAASCLRSLLAAFLSRLFLC